LNKVEEELNGLLGMKDSRGLANLLEDPTVKVGEKKLIFSEIAKKLQLAPLTISIVSKSWFLLLLHLDHIQRLFVIHRPNHIHVLTLCILIY